MLHDEFEFFIQNQERLVRRYDGQFIVIKNQEVIGSYPSEWKAYTETVKAHALGTFLIQKCEPGPSAYMVHLHPQIVPA